MDFDFYDFVDIEFPPHKNILYILFFSSDENGHEVPFYVGESSRGIGRFGDYISAKFSASTDFKVGEAIRFLQNRGFNVRIKYKESEDRKGIEKEIINILQEKSRLLNELEGYDYTKSNEEDERTKIHRFLEKMIQEKGIRSERNGIDISTKEINREVYTVNEHINQVKKSYSSDNNNQSNHIRIEGSVTRQGSYGDKKDICELNIHKEYHDFLPHEFRKEQPITLVIGASSYKAAVRETSARDVWVSSVLFTREGHKKVRLVDALEKIGLKYKDRITLSLNADGSYTLSGRNNSSFQ